MKAFVFIIVVGVLISACSSPAAPTPVDSAALEKACVAAGGKYLAQFNECENVSGASCTAMGGAFEECASACRHLPASVMCTAQCVPVCSFGAASTSRQPESVIAQLNNPLECNLLSEPQTIGGVMANYGCRAPGAFLTFVDTRSDPWTAGYFTTDSQITKVTYGPESVTVMPNPEK
jgi:hypothetical protein